MLAIEWTIGVAAALGAIYFGLPALAKAVLRRRFLARVRRGGCACLTFDDGPDPALTPAILEELNKAGVKATFFMIGERAAANPALAERVAHQGHEIGEHGLAHKNAWRSGPWASAGDLWNGAKVLAACDGTHPSTLRPPFGKLNLVTLIYAWLMRRKLVFWDVDPRDYAQQSPAEVARHVLERLARGSVVLLHDGRARPGSDPAVTLEALRLILERGGGRGNSLRDDRRSAGARQRQGKRGRERACLRRVRTIPNRWR